MVEFITAFVVGIVLVVIGFINRTGNISLMHSYHRKRVKEEDKIPFGKLVGLGTIIIGVAVAISAVLSGVAFYTENGIFDIISMVLIGAGLVVGIIIIICALIKYNKGIF